jgi:hypothetical protein
VGCTILNCLGGERGIAGQLYCPFCLRRSETLIKISVSLTILGKRTKDFSLPFSHNNKKDSTHVKSFLLAEREGFTPSGHKLRITSASFQEAKLKTDFRRFLIYLLRRGWDELGMIFN